MAELCAERAERLAKNLAEGAWEQPGYRKAAVHVARSAATSASAAKPIAEKVGAMLSGGTPVEVVVLVVGAQLARRDIVRAPRRDAPSIVSAKGRAPAKAPPAESHHAPPAPELHEKSSVVAKPFASNRGTCIPYNSTESDRVMP
jgi:hypothetical protein